METRLRTLRLSDEDWGMARQMAYELGYESRTALISAFLKGKISGSVYTKDTPIYTPSTLEELKGDKLAAVVYTPVVTEDEELEYEKNYDWGA